MGTLKQPDEWKGLQRYIFHPYFTRKNSTFASMGARIKAISYYLPDKIYSNDDFLRDFPAAANQNLDKIGIKSRRRVGEGQAASDLAYEAALKLFQEHHIDPKTIDFLILNSQETDYYTPATSCVLHGRLNLNQSCGTLDFSHGCSGYVYGLAMAEGMINTLGVRNVLFLTTSVLSNTFHPKDRSSHFVFGDAGSATLIQYTEEQGLGPYEFGTDGKGYDKIIVEDGEGRNKISDESHIETDDGFGNITSRATFRMDGMSVFRFSVNTVPPMITALLEKSGMTINDPDYFVFHQPNRLMNETIRKKLQIPEEKFIHDFENTGNTVHATIPIALKHLMDEGKITRGTKAVLAGFGVGLSWISTIARF